MSTVCAARSVNSPTAARLKYDPKKRAPLPIAPLIVIPGTMDALRNVPPGMNRQVPQLPACNLISVLHLDLTEVYALRRVAGLAGLLSIFVPFVLGLALARPLHILAPSSPMLPFTLLIAISMSITAFPVLARILADPNLSATKLGYVGIACAALNDVL